MDYNVMLTGVESQRDLVVIVLAASRMDGDERLPLTDGQKDAAMQAAKATLQIIGADVAETSSAVHIPAADVPTRVKITCEVEPVEQISAAPTEEDAPAPWENEDDAE